MTHVAKLPLGEDYLPDPFFVYPTVPPFYKFPDGKMKFVYTYGLLFIYPSYRDLVASIRNDYLRLFKFFEDRVRSILVRILSSRFGITKEKVEELLKEQPPKSSHTREYLITENIIRGIFIHEQQKLLEELNVNSEDRKILLSFSQKLKEFTDKLRERDIKPIAIIAIAIPNGLLKNKYLDKFVSGKNYGRSARYHYGEGIFEVIKEKTGKIIPRVIFLDINMKYLRQLKKYFKKIPILDYQLRWM